MCQEPPVSNQSTSNTSGDHSSTILSSPGSTVTNFSPPRFSKAVGKPTPLRSSVWTAGNTDQRSSVANTDSTQFTRRTASTQPIVETSGAPISNVPTPGRLTARARHPNNRGVSSTTGMNTLNAKNVVGIGSCLVNQRNGPGVTSLLTTGGMCRSLGVGLTLSQPVRTATLGGCSLTAKHRRSESPASGSDQPPNSGRFGKPSPVSFVPLNIKYDFRGNVVC